MEKTVNNDKETQKELFIATLAHDLKNPLNAQIISLEQLYNEKFGSLTALQKEILFDIIQSSTFMKEILSSLLYVYKFENGVVKLHKTSVDLDNLIKICLRNITPVSDERCVLVEYINIAKEKILFCDENYIRRVLLNMLNNIARYSYKNTKALVVLEDDEINYSIRFKNYAPPIPDDIKPLIFNKYNPGYNKNSGTGLGLYFSKKVIEAHNGVIELITQNSEIEFYIKIPKIEKNENVVIFS